MAKKRVVYDPYGNVAPLINGPRVTRTKRLRGWRLLAAWVAVFVGAWVLVAGSAVVLYQLLTLGLLWLLVIIGLAVYVIRKVERRNR